MTVAAAAPAASSGASPLLMAGLAVQALGSYQQNKQNALLAKLNNQEAVRAGDEQQNIITQNIQRSTSNLVGAEANIDIARMQARSEAIVAAAASGTAGLSVNDQILDVERNAAKAEFNETLNLQDTIANYERSRLGVAAQVRNRTSPVNTPNPFAAAATAAVQYASVTYKPTPTSKPT